jgi:hypothetical protein
MCPRIKRNLILISAVLCVVAAGLGGTASCESDQTKKTRPRRVSAVNRRTVTVKPSENLQDAINAANFGDTIILEAGKTYRGPLILPFKQGEGDEYVTIRTSDLEGIAREGERIDPAKHQNSLPKIVSPNKQVAVGTAPQAHHFRFIGIEFSPATDADYVYNLIDLGASDYSSLAQFPHHLIFDRCYVHSTGLNKARRGFALNSAETSVINSYVSGFAGAGDETQAVAGWNGPGPFHIINNFLQAGGEIVFFGGTDPSIQNLVPSDIEIRRNYLHRPASWRGRALIKGSFELKNAKRTVVEGNQIESEILTTAFVITVRNQYGKAPWSTIEDLEIKNNIVNHATTGVNFMGSDNEHPSQEAKRIRITNNLFLNITPDDPHNVAYFLQTNGGESVVVEHNTVQQDGNMITSFNRPTLEFAFRNNIVMFNLYGIVCEITGSACPRDNFFCGCFPGGSLQGNVIIDNLGSAAREGVLGKYPKNVFAPSIGRVGFVNSAQGDYSLGQGSSYHGRATDGGDPGVDLASMIAAGVLKAKTGEAQSK